MKIPANAKKVFTGVIFSVYQWEQEMFDGSKETFECLSRADCVNIIATQNNHILITDQEQPGNKFIAPFGGRVDPGESLIEAAKRELREEGGLESDDWSELFNVQPYGKIDSKIHTFIARNCVKTQETHLDPGEKISVKAVTFEEFLTIVRKEDFRSKEMALYVMKMELEGRTEELRKQIFGN